MIFRKRKGQSMVIEEVILMSMGVIILIGLTSIFTMTKNEVSTAIQKEETSHVGNFIKGHMNRMILNNITGVISLSLPRKINNEYYIIQGYESGVKKEFFIMLSDYIYTVKVPVPITGSSVSDNGELMINCSKVDGEYKINILG